MRDEFCGRVKIIFQHSEDRLSQEAQRELVAKGIMDADVDAIVGTSCTSPDEDPEEYGKVRFRSGPMTTFAAVRDRQALEAIVRNHIYFMIQCCSLSGDRSAAADPSNEAAHENEPRLAVL